MRQQPSCTMYGCQDPTESYTNRCQVQQIADSSGVLTFLDSLRHGRNHSTSSNAICNGLIHSLHLGHRCSRPEKVFAVSYIRGESNQSASTTRTMADEAKDARHPAATRKPKSNTQLYYVVVLCNENLGSSSSVTPLCHDTTMQSPPTEG